MASIPAPASSTRCGRIRSSSRVKLISEPWDIGPGGYQLGHHPPGFAEWNDRFRDSSAAILARRCRRAAGIRGAAGRIGRLVRLVRPAVHGRRSITPPRHDGFTLADVVSFTRRHNEANGEDNKDGAAENYSANWGVEGPTNDESILEARARVQRAMLATVIFAHGTPMLLGGDEFGRTQRGNNNPYCQDNELSWLDWTLADSPRGPRADGLRRQAHCHTHGAALHCAPANFLHGKAQLAPRTHRHRLVRCRWRPRFPTIPGKIRNAACSACGAPLPKARAP